MISTAQPVKSSGNHLASSKRGFGLKPFTSLSFKCILLALQMTREEKGVGGGYEKQTPIPAGRNEILAASHGLWEVSFYLRYHQFSPAPLFYEAKHVFLEPVAHTGLLVPAEHCPIFLLDKYGPFRFLHQQRTCVLNTYSPNTFILAFALVKGMIWVCSSTFFQNCNFF